MHRTGLCEFWLVCECVSPVMPIGDHSSNPASLVWPDVCEPQHRQYVRAVTCSCGAINHLIPSFNLGQITVWAMGAPHPNTGWCALGRYGGRKNEPVERKRGLWEERGRERRGSCDEGWRTNRELVQCLPPHKEQFTTISAFHIL